MVKTSSILEGIKKLFSLSHVRCRRQTALSTRVVYSPPPSRFFHPSWFNNLFMSNILPAMWGWGRRFCLHWIVFIFVSNSNNNQNKKEEGNSVTTLFIHVSLIYWQPARTEFEDIISISSCFAIFDAVALNNRFSSIKMRWNFWKSFT